MTEPVKKYWTTYIGQAAGHPAAFLVVILYAALWLAFSPATFEWNAVATLAVFMMKKCARTQIEQIQCISKGQR